MSNDDQPEELVKYIARLKPSVRFLIITLCPNFDEPEARTVEILGLLQKRFELFLWVLLHDCVGFGRMVSDGEIARLQTYGTVELFERTDEPPARAEALRAFISKNL